MEQYELAEKQVITELPQRYPQLFEIFIIVKLFITTIFNSEITDEKVYYGIIWMWINEFVVSICVLITTFYNVKHGYSISTAFLIVGGFQVIAFIIHAVVGHTKNV